MSTEYDIRHYEAADRDEYQELYGTVFGSELSDAVLDWKFEQNPYVSRVPIIIAETNGTIVGSRAFVGQKFRANGRSVLGLQGTDAMVHPDHRRRGVYSQLVEYTVEYYTERDDAVRFTFPNQRSLPGNLKHGARLVDTVPTYYRIQNPTALLDGSIDASVERLIELVGTPLARGYLGARELFRSDRTNEVTLHRHTEMPAKALASLYERTAPERIHTVRDEAFYRWRFDNPRWEYTVYTASQDGTPVSALVVGTRTMDGAVVTRLADILPVGGTPHRKALAQLLAAVLPEYRESDLIAAFGSSVPRSLLAAAGFLSDKRPPLSAVTTPTPMVVRSFLADESWNLDGWALTDLDSWMLSYSDRDSS